MSLTDTACRYLETFAKRDLSAVGAFFSDDVSLRDWEIGLTEGKAAVVEANRKIFSAVESFAVEILETYEAGSTVVVELKLVVDGDVELLVTDVIGFDDDGKITHIRAYRGS